MKICKRCGLTKELDEYYQHPMMADGYLNFCKDCVRRRVSDYQKTAQGRLVDKQRESSTRRKLWKRQQQRKYRLRNPDRNRARQIYHEALRKGQITKEPCQKCGDMQSEAHHPDYKRPLDVVWLCRSHHREEDIRLAKGQWGKSTRARAENFIPF